MWAPGMELRLSGLVASTLPSEATKWYLMCLTWGFGWGRELSLPCLWLLPLPEQDVGYVYTPTAQPHSTVALHMDPGARFPESLGSSHQYVTFSSLCSFLSPSAKGLESTRFPGLLGGWKSPREPGTCFGLLVDARFARDLQD